MADRSTKNQHSTLNRPFHIQVEEVDLGDVDVGDLLRTGTAGEAEQRLQDLARTGQHQVQQVGVAGAGAFLQGVEPTGAGPAKHQKRQQ